MQIDTKVWVVTGAGNGIGRELVLRLLWGGARVAAVDVDRSGLQETVTVAEVGERLSTHVVDITDRAAVEALPEAVLAAHGQVDGLVNNAGIIQPFVTVDELDYPTIQRVLDVNLMGTLHMVKAFLPHLQQRPEAHIANVSSMGGFFPFPGQTVYGAGKAAVRLLTEGLYAELLDSHVRVSLIMPGAVATAISQHSGAGSGNSADSGNVPMTTPDKAARIMVTGIEKNKLHIYVGTDARLMSLAIKVAPRAAIRLVQKAMAKRLPSPDGALDGAPASAAGPVGPEVPGGPSRGVPAAGRDRER